MVATAERPTTTASATPPPVFQWAPFSSLPVKPYIAAAEIDRIRAKYGRLDLADIVTESVAPDSPLHRCFEWNDTDAARLHRKEQARYILRSLVVVYPKEAGERPSPVRYIVSLKEPDPEDLNEKIGPLSARSFIPLTAALGDETLRRRLLKQALDEAKHWRSRYESLRELGKVFTALSDVIATVE